MRKIDVARASGWQELLGKRGKVPGNDKSRLGMVQVIFGGLMVVILLRLVSLQIVSGKEMRERSDSNRIYQRVVSGGRGVMYDRNGEALVMNRPVYRLLTDDQGRMLMEMPLIGREEAMGYEVGGEENRVIHEEVRYYAYANLMAHILGYVGEADEEEMSKSGLVLGEVVGKAGLEKEYNERLMGVAGMELIEIDAGGKLLRRVGERKGSPGMDLTLAIDLGLQEVVDGEMVGVERGVVVVTVPATGEVLAMVSHPSFDANVFSVSSEEVGDKKNVALREIWENEDRPLLNRAIGGTYPPGSVFKVVPAAAGLELGELTRETQIEDVGELVVDEYRYGNWYFDKYGRTEGLIGVVDALRRSNDIFFYQLGTMIGPDRLAKWAEEFGLGKETGVDLPGEVTGLVPNTLWKERVKGEAWFLGNTYHMAIGQGDMLVTPLQVNQMMGVIANGGRWCKPFLVKEIGGEEQGMIRCREVGLSNGTIEAVKEGLVGACSRGGTAFPFFDIDLSLFGEEYASSGRNQVECKTGTAQYGDPEEKTHAWLSVFAPADNPEILVTVLVEGGGEGSEVAAPIARKIVEYYFRR